MSFLLRTRVTFGLEVGEKNSIFRDESHFFLLKKDRGLFMEFKFIYYSMLNKYIIGEKSVYFNGRVFLGPLKSRVVTALFILTLPIGLLIVKR